MKKRTKILSILMTMLMLILSSTVAFGEEDNYEDKTLAPYFYVKGPDSSVDTFPLKETYVSTNINGVIAETYVTQTYTNEGSGPINASYVFPASSNVTVHGLKMTIGDQVVTARIKEKEEAKQEFEEAKSEGKSASLMEQQRPNVFTMDLANVMPGDVVRIELHYTEMVVSTEGTYEFVFPTVVGPRYFTPSKEQDQDSDLWVETPYLKEGVKPAGKYNISVTLSAGVPIADVTSSSHKIKVSKPNETTAKIDLSNPENYAGDRDFILDYKLTGDEVHSGLMLGKGEDENFFMLMVQPPERVKTENIPPREYIFVLDISGSMYGYPLDTGKELITNLVSNLRETDSFNLILFSDELVQLANKSLPATAKNVKRATNLINRQDGGGGTELMPALEAALALPADKNIARSVVVITDGYLSGEREVFDLIDKNITTTSFFSFGIGTSVNRYLIDGIATTGLGESFVVTDPSEASETAERFRTYIQSPVLTDIKVTYDGFDAYDIEPDKLPTLFAQRPIVVFGKWRGEPAGTIRITGKTGNKDYVQDISVADIKPDEANNAISYLWARTKVENLIDYGYNGEDPEAIKKEVTELGLKYSMMTPYTSFVAVLETIRNEDGNSTDVDQPLPLPDKVSDLAVGGYTIGSEPGSLILVGLMVCVLCVGILYRRNKKKTVC